MLSPISIPILTLLLLLPSLALAAPTAEKRALPVLMGLAKSFGALSGSTLTSTGATAITGNGGVWPGSAITGFPPGTASGVLAAGTTLAQEGQAACLEAYNKYIKPPLFYLFLCDVYYKIVTH